MAVKSRLEKAAALLAFSLRGNYGSVQIGARAPSLEEAEAPTFSFSPTLSKGIGFPWTHAPTARRRPRSGRALQRRRPEPDLPGHEATHAGRSLGARPSQGTSPRRPPSRGRPPGDARSWQQQPAVINSDNSFIIIIPALPFAPESLPGQLMGTYSHLGAGQWCAARPRHERKGQGGVRWRPGGEAEEGGGAEREGDEEEENNCLG